MNGTGYVEWRKVKIGARIRCGRAVKTAPERGIVGKRYARELDGLAGTYSWAIGASVDILSRSVRSISSLPLLAVGSGGSFTTAQFAAAVHREYTSGLATALTPLEAVETPQSLRKAGVLVLSGRGRNPDVLGAFRRIVAREPRRVMVLCGSADSPLARLALERPFVDVSCFDLPLGKDGFLATNSLLASCILLLRAYASAYGTICALPDSFAELLGDDGPPGRTQAEIDGRCQALWKRPTLIILYGPETYPAAVDLESKFTEAALGSTQLADYRNFAHGRHHWIAKRGADTGVLAIISDGDRKVAESTLALLPRRIPAVRVSASGRGAIACLAALAKIFMVTGSAGAARGIDPGDPGVPAFGRRIYHMRALGPDESLMSPVQAREAVAIERKSGLTITGLSAQDRLDDWRLFYGDFVRRLTATTFHGVVFDYDGTLCDEAHRFEPLSPAIGRQLNRLLHAGVVLGVATGRGKSVRQTLRAVIDRTLWPRVVVGYYNGGDIGSLDQDDRPDSSDLVDDTLKPIAEALLQDTRFVQYATVTLRRPQITIESRPEARWEGLWDLLLHFVYGREQASAPGVVALRSTHSIDLVAPGVSKRAVVEAVRGHLQIDVRGEIAILCIGDRGRWPGNDFSLLTTPYSLSVDEVSPDPHSCWNLTAPGRRGVDGTLEYLRYLTKTESALRFTIR